MSRILRRILVAIDGSPTANDAAGVALGLAGRHGAELIFVTAVDHGDAIAKCAEPYGGVDPEPLLELLDFDAKTCLYEAERRAGEARVAATSALLEGTPAAAIVAYVKARSVDAIVIGTHGKRGLERFFLGSTAEDVLRTTDVPTFVVRASKPHAPAAFERILVALDGSEPSAAASAFALELSETDGSRLLLCHVTESGAPSLPLDEAVREARSRGARAETVTVEGSPVQQLLLAAERLEADAIAIGTHGRRGLSRLLPGSVAEGVVRRSPVPVVVVREQRVRPCGSPRTARPDAVTR